MKPEGQSVELPWSVTCFWMTVSHRVTPRLYIATSLRRTKYTMEMLAAPFIISNTGPVRLSTTLLTYSTVQSPSWEANWFAASQEIPRILCNPKVHYRTHKCPPPVPILGQPNPVHIPTSHLLEIHPNIIHPSMPRSPQWSLSLRFPTKTLYAPSPHPYAPYITKISYLH